MFTLQQHRNYYNYKGLEKWCIVWQNLNWEHLEKVVLAQKQIFDRHKTKSKTWKIISFYFDIICILMCLSMTIFYFFFMFFFFFFYQWQVVFKVSGFNTTLCFKPNVSFFSSSFCFRLQVTGKSVCSKWLFTAKGPFFSVV